MSDYYDRQGQPIDMMTWARMFEDEAVKLVARTEVGEVLVSTVWIGLDHSFGTGSSGPAPGRADHRRPSSRRSGAALAGHERMVVHGYSC